MEGQQQPKTKNGNSGLKVMAIEIEQIRELMIKLDGDAIPPFIRLSQFQVIAWVKTYLQSLVELQDKQDREGSGGKRLRTEE